MPETKQPTYIAITPGGEKHLQQMVAVGYTNLPMAQQVEWDILHDLILQGGKVWLRLFLAEGRDSTLGRTFAQLSERPHGRQLTEYYGKTLHNLIKQGHIKAFRKETQPEEAV